MNQSINDMLKKKKKIQTVQTNNHILPLGQGDNMASRQCFYNKFTREMFKCIEKNISVCLPWKQKIADYSFWIKIAYQRGTHTNKRAMMALNRSPESVSPLNEFYLLYYYCSNL